MNFITVTTTTPIAEYLLDLPANSILVDAAVKDEVLVLTIKTDDYEKGSYELEYVTDETGLMTLSNLKKR